MAWQGVDGIVRARDINQARLEQTLRLNTVIAQWEQDLASLQDTTAVPALSCDGATCAWCAAPRTACRSWPGRCSGSAWQRWAGPAVTPTCELQESWLRSQQFQGNEPGSCAARRRHEWQVYFFRGNAWCNCQSSGDTSPACGRRRRAAARAAARTACALVLAFGGSGLTRDLVLAPHHAMTPRAAAPSAAPRC